MGGLGPKWRVVEEALAEIVDVYDRVNRFLSLGNDFRLRVRALREASAPNARKVLDAGAGPGTFSKLILRENGEADVVALEPLRVMCDRAVAIGSIRYSLVRGVFERAPFRERAFDLIVTGFAIRDSLDLRRAISEMHRVLRAGGKMLICDIAKPDRPPLKLVMGAYWFAVAPFLGFLVSGARGLKVWFIYPTYVRWPTVGELRSLIAERFRLARLKVTMFGGALTLVAEKSCLDHTNGNTPQESTTTYTAGRDSTSATATGTLEGESAETSLSTLKVRTSGPSTS
ncbi:MAG: class I SAM-dependent methyltransferase [Thaumarchaeota archaeon]|nr:class I SAM-dependent methyltransferase [Candidatus Calditenuaceae archaeon]MDW8041822.1 class I SAM-dependent methyltransferase [Nitrososphaerota archaeon]